MIDFKSDKLSTELREIKEKEEERLLEFLSQRYGIPTLSNFASSVSLSALQLITKEQAEKASFVIYKRERKKLFAAIRDIKNQDAIKLEQSLISRGFSIEKHFASTKTIKKIIQYYDDIKTSTVVSAGLIDLSKQKEFDVASQTTTTVDEIQKKLKETEKENHAYRTTKQISTVLVSSIALSASDIHLESIENGLLLRFRVYGVLSDIYKFDKNTGKKIETRIKLICNMKISNTKIAQDGRFTIRTSSRDIESRVSTIPNPYGESVVIRILDPNTTKVGLSSLGIPEKLLGVFKKEIKKPHGMVIVTGPTGSGKTTTLYSFLREVLTPEIKIITLEEPIEYHVDGIVQTPITKDYSFATGLRAILRQDPDIILVGEIRDPEVAKVAVDAALTGHLVFSTLHTNDVSGAIPRLMELGISPQTIASALNLIVAQRLIRKICPDSKEKENLSEETKTKIKELVEGFPEAEKDLSQLDFSGAFKTNLAYNEGKCHGGYLGVTGLYEALLVDSNIKKILFSGGGAEEIKGEVFKQGFLTIKQDGIKKFLSGKTTLEEVSRVTGDVF